MRIIAGAFRGRRILPPAGDITRPITDRAKQSLFDVLQPILPDAMVYDCFAGTGSMGLEAISRAVRQVIFFERDRDALARLRQNIDALGVQDRCQIIGTDLFKWFAANKPASRADLVFLDPPYRCLQEQSEALQSLSRELVDHHLQTNATVVFRHDSADQLELAGLARYDLREYGRMTIELLRPIT